VDLSLLFNYPPFEPSGEMGVPPSLTQKNMWSGSWPCLRRRALGGNPVLSEFLFGGTGRKWSLLLIEHPVRSEERCVGANRTATLSETRQPGYPSGKPVRLRGLRWASGPPNSDRFIPRFLCSATPSLRAAFRCDSGI